MLFDNKTKNTAKKAEQLKQLLSLVDDVDKKNGGKPYTNELFVEFQVSVGGNPGNFYLFVFGFFFELSLRIRLSLGNT